MDNNPLSNHLTTPASYGASVIVWLCSLTLSDVGIIVSIVLGILTFAVNWYYKSVERSDRLRHLQTPPLPPHPQK